MIASPFRGLVGLNPFLNIRPDSLSVLPDRSKVIPLGEKENRGGANARSGLVDSLHAAASRPAARSVANLVRPIVNVASCGVYATRRRTRRRRSLSGKVHATVLRNCATIRRAICTRLQRASCGTAPIFG